MTIWWCEYCDGLFFCLKTTFCLMITGMAFFFSVVGLMIIGSNDLNMQNGIWISISMSIFTIGLCVTFRLCLHQCKKDSECCFSNESSPSVQNDLQVPRHESEVISTSPAPYQRNNSKDPPPSYNSEDPPPNYLDALALARENLENFKINP